MGPASMPMGFVVSTIPYRFAECLTASTWMGSSTQEAQDLVGNGAGQLGVVEPSSMVAARPLDGNRGRLETNGTSSLCREAVAGELGLASPHSNMPSRLVMFRRYNAAPCGNIWKHDHPCRWLWTWAATNIQPTTRQCIRHTGNATCGSGPARATPSRWMALQAAGLIQRWLLLLIDGERTHHDERARCEGCGPRAAGSIMKR